MWAAAELWAELCKLPYCGESVVSVTEQSNAARGYPDQPEDGPSPGGAEEGAEAGGCGRRLACTIWMPPMGIMR